ncbi:MAG: hypothetical protein ACI9XU_000355 [Arenicella sp.]|jgi:hypothetical protein
MVALPRYRARVYEHPGAEPPIDAIEQHRQRL